MTSDSRCRIAGTDLSVSRLGFGTATLHHLWSTKDRLQVLAAAADAGITHFDTAPLYGFGLAELALGRFVRSSRNRFTIATKFGLYPPGSPRQGTTQILARKMIGKVAPKLSTPIVEWSVRRARQSLSDSLSRLNTDYVDVLFLHEPDHTLLNTDELQSFLEQEKQRGRIRYCGLAGTAAKFISLLKHPLATVVQAKDSLTIRDADVLTVAGRELQFTFGYFASDRAPSTGGNNGTLKAALERNVHGAVIFSSRHVSRVVDVAPLLRV